MLVDDFLFYDGFINSDLERTPDDSFKTYRIDTSQFEYLGCDNAYASFQDGDYRYIVQRGDQDLTFKIGELHKIELNPTWYQDSLNCEVVDNVICLVDNQEFNVCCYDIGSVTSVDFSQNYHCITADRSGNAVDLGSISKFEKIESYELLYVVRIGQYTDMTLSVDELQEYELMSAKYLDTDLDYIETEESMETAETLESSEVDKSEDDLISLEDVFKIEDGVLTVSVQQDSVLDVNLEDITLTDFLLIVIICILLLSIVFNFVKRLL